MNLAALVESFSIPKENLRYLGVSARLKPLTSLEGFGEGEKDDMKLGKCGEVNEADFEKTGTGMEGSK